MQIVFMGTPDFAVGALEALITQGYEYASPTGGRNIQSVQMADLDGDGQQEALAFFRMSSDEKPLKIFVFKIEGGSYARYCTIESSGTAIDSVQYEDLTGNGHQEIIVGWRISADVQTVAVYVPQPEPYVLLQSGYTRFTVTDLDGDGVVEPDEWTKACPCFEVKREL